MDSKIKPIVITGIHRSGTTWVGRIISNENKSVHYVYEPMHSHSPPGIPKPKFPHILYGDGGEYPDHEKAVSDILKGEFPVIGGSPIGVKRRLSLFKKSLGIRWAYLNKKRMVLKAPEALFFSDYFVNSHQAHVIILTRHPCAFVTSCLRLNWGINLSILTR
jgi:hypothetical protein